MQDHEINLVTNGSKFEGTLEFDGFTRFNGSLKGNLHGTQGSQIILGENGVVEGKIDGDIIIIDGFVRGEIRANTKVIVSETGRVIGNIEAPNFSVKFGGYFEGQCLMEKLLPSLSTATN